MEPLSLHDTVSIDIRFLYSLELRKGKNGGLLEYMGLRSIKRRSLFLEELREVRSLCPAPWMLAGDFNMIYCAEDKNNDNINGAMIGRFHCFANDLELKEIPVLG